MDEKSFVIVKSVIEDIAKEHHIKKYQINTKEDQFTGRNYTSTIIRAQIIDNEDKNDQINLFIKLPLIPEGEKNVIKGLFNSEYMAYTEILPSLLKYQREHQLPVEKHLTYPKFYKGSLECEGSHMIFEDISYKGYQMQEKAKPLSFDQVEGVLKSLADYHSISLAMRFKDFELFENLTEKLPKGQANGDMLQKMMTNVTSKIFPQLKCKNKIKILNDFIQNCGEKLIRCTESKLTEPYNLICHGDFHINNMMFREKNSKSEVMFVDWQVLRYASPVVDMFTFIFSSTEKSFREKYLKKLCDSYYSTLDENLKLFGCDISTIYPRYIFDEQLINISDLGILFGIVGATVHHREPGEETDINTMLGQGSDFTITANEGMIKLLEDLADDITTYSKLKADFLK